MMCQHCNHNHAENTLVFDISGEVQQLHLCGECTRKLKEYARLMHLVAQGGAFGFQDQRQTAAQQPIDTNYIPADAGEEIKRRRRLNQLHGQLEKAIQSEHYEEAARIRDAIKQQENGVYA